MELKVKSRLRIYGILGKQYLLKYRWWFFFMILFSLAAGAAQVRSAGGEMNYRGIAVGVCWSDEKGRELLSKLEEEKGIFRKKRFGNGKQA